MGRQAFSGLGSPAFTGAQVAGGIAGAGILFVIASGKAGFDVNGGFASNGFGEHSPGGYSLMACFVHPPVSPRFRSASA